MRVLLPESLAVSGDTSGRASWMGLRRSCTVSRMIAVTELPWNGARPLSSA